MNGKRNLWAEQVALNLLRIVAGFLFWQHGAQKLFGTLGREAPVDFFTMMGLAGILETVGGVLLVLGLFTRPVAFILSGEMAWAYFSSHAPGGFWPIMNRGELAALYAVIFLYVAARGVGGFSVDGLFKVLGGRKPKPVEPGGGKGKKEEPVKGGDIPELTEEDLAEDPEIAELLKDHR
ncbi:MAG: DoxX family protein [Longimicrobiales bacterium]